MFNHSVLNTDRFDRRRFKEIFEMSNRLQEIKNAGEKEFPGFFSLMSDIWASLYKMKPELLDKEEIDQNLKMNYQLMEQVMSEKSYQSFHESTKLDDLSSAIGAVNYSQKIQEWIVEQKQQNEQLQQAIQKAQEKQMQLEQAQQQLEQAEQELQKAQANGNQKTEKSAKTNRTKANKKVEQATIDLNQAMQDIANAMQSSIQNKGTSLAKAIQSANEQTSEQKQALIDLLAGGLGSSSGEGELQKIPLRDQIKLAEKLATNDKIKKIAEWAGRFKSIARKKQKTKHTETVERSGVTLGSEIERLLPIELAQFKHSSTKLDFLQRFTENRTMMYAPKGKEKLGKGPIVLCLDQSGSMKDLDNQSKGFALALLMIAKKQHRDFAIILFSSASKCKTFTYEKGKITPKDLVQLEETFLSGGTCFINPLKEAVRIITNERRFKRADIVFVTDGDPSDHYAVSNYMEAYKNIKKEKEFNCTSVLLGSKCKESSVRLFSDKIVRGNSFFDEKVMDSAFTI